MGAKFAKILSLVIKNSKFHMIQAFTFFKLFVLGDNMQSLLYKLYDAHTTEFSVCQARLLPLAIFVILYTPFRCYSSVEQTWTISVSYFVCVYIFGFISLCTIFSIQIPLTNELQISDYSII